MRAYGAGEPVPMRRVIVLEFEIEPGCITKFQNLDARRAGFIAVDMVGGNEKAVALAQGGGAQDQGAGGAVIQTMAGHGYAGAERSRL